MTAKPRGGPPDPDEHPRREDPRDPAHPDPLTVEELKLELARTQERLAATERERDGLAVQLDRLSDRYDSLRDDFARQQLELGRLQQVEAASAELRQERDTLHTERDEARGQRDDLRRELDQVHSTIPAQVRTQLDETLGEVNQAHADEVEGLQAEQERLQARITELEETAQADSGPAMTTSDLAGHFADVLNVLGNRPSAPGESFAAALTGLNVQAKGLLRADEDGNVEILTAQAAAAPAEQLSTVQMELKLLPRLPGQEPGTPR